MRCEIPELGRCCFCFPLRLGLLVWCYAKLVVTVMLLSTMSTNLIGDWGRFWRSIDVIFAIIYVISIISMAADTIFLIIFAISAHKKDPKIMNWFSKFCIYMLVVYALCFILSVVYAFGLNHFFGFYIGFTIGIICFSCLVSQVYMTILVRSEVLKLKRGTNHEFINRAADTTTSAMIDINNVA